MTALSIVKPDQPDLSARDLVRILAAYRTPSLTRSLFEIFVTIIPLAGLVALALVATHVSYWLALPLCLPAAGFLVRLFLIQHDCSHGAFFASRKTNTWVGRLLGVFTMTPFAIWQRSHLIHHASHGNLDHRGIGDVYTLTVEEYAAKSTLRQFAYRLYRSPLVLFGLGPIFVFLLHHRLPVDFMKDAKHWVSAMATNIGITTILIAGGLVFGWLPFLTIYLTTTCLAAIIGVWLFYVQHQFDDMVWDTSEAWQLHDAALYGSTYYALPPVLSWITANIGIHHIHHLYSKIPFYRLSEVLTDHTSLAEINRLTLRESFRTVHLKLWDTATRRMVPFSALD